MQVSLCERRDVILRCVHEGHLADLSAEVLPLGHILRGCPLHLLV